MSSPPRKRDNNESGDSSPDSSSDGTDPLMVEHPHNRPPEQTSSKDDFLPITTDKRSSLDTLLQGYTSFMVSALNQDRGIKLLQYTIWMFSYFFKNKIAFRDACKKLYNELSFARYVNRLLGLPPAIEAAKSGSWGAVSTTNPGIHKILGKVLAWSMIGYYPLEHGAYLQWQTPKLLFPKTGGPSRLAEKLSAWSCRFWLTYTLVEIFQCWLKLREESQKLLKQGLSKKKDDPVDADDEQIGHFSAPDSATVRNLRLQILRDVLFTLPAIHWSLPNWDTNPWLPEPAVNTLMWLESVVCMYQSVRNFQQN